MAYEKRGVGLSFGRMVDGEVVQQIDRKTNKRMDMLVEMDQRRQELTAGGDWQGLYGLAVEYETWRAHGIADRILKLVAEHIDVTGFDKSSRAKIETEDERAARIARNNRSYELAIRANRRGVWGHSGSRNRAKIAK